MSANHTHTIHCDDNSADSADLRIEKSVDNQRPEIGENVIWTIAIKNEGPGNATSVRVEDLLPPGVYHVSDNASYGDYDEHSGEWYIGNLAVGTCHTLTIVTTVTDTSVAQVNSATISSNVHDTDDSNNNDTAWIHAQGSIADLSVVKSVDNDRPAIGDEVSWTVTINNDGPDTATNVIVNDALPAGVTHISDSASTGEYDESSSQWILGELASGASQTLTIVTRVEDSTAQWNSATVNSDTYDPDWSDNTGHASVFGGEADVSISKTVDNSSPNVGESVTWTVVVSNNGSDKAVGVVVKDTLPDGVRHSADDATTGYYDEHQGQWWIGELEAGANETLTITTTVVDAANAQVNTGTVSSDTHDPDLDNNTASASTDAESADVVVEKTVNDDNPSVGDTITWTVVVRNDGPDTAENTVLHDALPNGVVYESDDATVGSYDNVTGQWMLGDLPSGASETLTIDTVVSASFLQMNVAVATSDTFDPELCNNTDFAITDADAAADLAVSKSVSNATPNLNDTVTWTIEVTNLGPDSASYVVVQDLLPDGVELQNTDLSDGAFNDVSGVWSLDSLASGQTETLMLETKVVDLDEQQNTVSVSSDTFDFNPDNDTASDDVDAVAADLGITKTVSDATPNLGDDVSWTIEVSNLGPDAAVNVVVKDTLPAGVEFVSADVTTGEYNETDTSWSFPDLASGETETLTLVTTVTDLQSQENTATVSSGTHDDNPANDTDTDSTDAVSADLQVTKTVSDEAPNIGDIISWTIEITNNGPDTASQIKVQELLPSGVSYVADNTVNPASAGDYDNASGGWTLDTLEAGVTETLTLNTEVTSLDIQLNTVTVTSDTVDSDSSNNTDEATTDPVGADLQISKVVSDEAPALGDTVEWTLQVENLGPDAATSVVAVDSLPDGVAFESASTGTGTFFTTTDGTITWQVGTLDANTTATLTVLTEVTSLDIQVNKASVTAAPGEDRDPSNNSAEDETDAVQVDLSVSKEANVETAASGDTIVWTVTASNDGPDDATGVTLTDLLPAGLDFVDAATATGSYLDGVWTIGDLEQGNMVTAAITTTVSDTASAGDLTNIVEVATQDQADLDSTPGNDDGDQSEDDEASATVSINAGLSANPNNLDVEGSGGASINAVVVIDRSSSMKAEITIDGDTQTRLFWNIEAVKDFAARTEVKAVKIIAFDGRVTDGSTIHDGGDSNLTDKNTIPPTEVSEWIDVSGGDNLELDTFLDTLAPWGSGTNYQAAIDATMAQTDTPPEGAAETNYYFFSDGVPTAGGASSTHKLVDEKVWQDFAEANFDHTFAVGFGGAIKARDALEEVAHVTGSPDDPSINDDPNLLLIDEIDAIPSVLNNFASTSVGGNAIGDDASEHDFSITSMVFDGVTYAYDNNKITESGPSQGAFLTNSFIVVDTKQSGSLQFDFDTGDFTYFAPTTDTPLTETFEYTITDSEGEVDSASVTINVTASPADQESSNGVLPDDWLPTDVINPDADDLDQFLPSTNGENAPGGTLTTEPTVSTQPGNDWSVIANQLPIDTELHNWESGATAF